MKKLIFILAVLLCFFLIGCKEKKVTKKMNGMSADSKISLESKQDYDKNSNFSHAQNAENQELLEEIIVFFDVNAIRFINVTVNPESSWLGIISDKETIEEIALQFNGIRCRKINITNFEILEEEANAYVINIFDYNGNNEKIIINADGSFYYYNGSLYLSNVSGIEFNKFKNR